MIPRILFEGLGDITDVVVFEQTELNISAQGEASASTLVIKDTGTVDEFLTGKRITVDLDGDVIWAGFLMRAARKFWFAVDSETTSNRQWHLTLADIGILFSKRVVHKLSSPKVVEGPSYRDPTYDNVMIEELLANWLDLSADDLDTTTLVDAVAIVNPSSGACTPPDQSFYPFNGSMTWGEAMSVIAQVPAAIWGLLPGEPLGTSPFGRLFYADVDEEDAPYDLSDQPGAGTESVTENFSTPGTDGWPSWTYDYGTASFASVASGIATAVIPYPSGAIGQYRDLLSVEGSVDWTLLTRFRIDGADLCDPSMGLYISGFSFYVNVFSTFGDPGNLQVGYDLYSIDDSTSSDYDEPWDTDWRFLEARIVGGVVELRIWKDGDPRPSSPNLTCAATTPATPFSPPYDNTLYAELNMGSSGGGGAQNGVYDIDYITISKASVGTAAGYREMTIWEDGSELVNESFAWGAGKGSDNMVFDHRTDNASVSGHGLWQQGDLIFNIWCDDTIEKVTDSIVNGSPSSRRGHKNPIIEVECQTDTDGFKVGQKVRFINEEFSFDEVLPIRRMGIRFPTPDARRYDLKLSEELDPWGFQNAPPPFRFGRLPPFDWDGPPEGWLPPNPDCGITDSFHRVGAPGVSDAGIAYVEINGNDPSPSGLSYQVDGTGLVITCDDESVEFGSIDLPLPVDQFEAFFIVDDYATDQFGAAINLQSPGITADSYLSLDIDGNQFHVVDIGGNSSNVSFSFDGSPFYVRVRIEPTRTQAKVWYVGDAEPAAWQAEIGGGARSGTPAISFEFDGFVTNGDSARIRELEVWDASDTVSVFTAPPYDTFDRVETVGWGDSTPTGETWTGSGVTSLQESNVLGSKGRMWIDGTLDGGGANTQEIPVSLDLDRPLGLFFQIQFVTASDESIPLVYRGPGDTPNPFINLFLEGATSGEALVSFTLGDAALDTEAQTLEIGLDGDTSTTIDWSPVIGAWYWCELRWRSSSLEVRLWLVGANRPLAPTATAAGSIADPLVGALSFTVDQRQVDNVGGSSGVTFPDFEVWFKELAFLNLSGTGQMINRCYALPTECWVNPPYELDNFNRTLDGRTGETSWGRYIWDDTDGPDNPDLSVAGRWQVDISGLLFSHGADVTSTLNLPLDSKSMNINVSFGIELPEPAAGGSVAGRYQIEIQRDGGETIRVSCDLLKDDGDADWTSQLSIQTPTGVSTFGTPENGSFFAAAGLAITITPSSVAAAAGGLSGSRGWTADPGPDPTLVQCVLEMRGELDNSPSFPADNNAFHVWAETLRVTTDLGNCVDVPRAGV